MTLWFLIFLSVLQGVTELFPVSSLGHTLLVPGLIGMHIDEHAPQLLPFLVALHLGVDHNDSWSIQLAVDNLCNSYAPLSAKALDSNLVESITAARPRTLSLTFTKRL